MNARTDRQDATKRRDNGMSRATEHANRVHGDWFDQAATMLLLYIQQHRGREFMAEGVREWAAQNGMPNPPDLRAWGGVFNRASRDGVIRHVRYSRQFSPTCHCSPKSVWVSA